MPDLTTPPNLTVELKDFIRDVPDFPKPGILFRDISPLLAAPHALRHCIDRFVDRYRDEKIDAIVAAEARGFIFAPPLAMALGASFIPIRKPGKLPAKTHRFDYELEYGTDTLEMHVDAVSAGQRVLVLDDLLATGGTVDACCQLVEKAGADVVSCAFVIELTALGGAHNIAPRDVFSLVRY